MRALIRTGIQRKTGLSRPGQAGLLLPPLDKRRTIFRTALRKNSHFDKIEKTDKKSSSFLPCFFAEYVNIMSTAKLIKTGAAGPDTVRRKQKF